MTRCSVCGHPRLEAIRAALEAGTSYRAVGREFGLTDASIRRHLRHRNRDASTVAHGSRGIAGATLPTVALLPFGVAALLRAASADLLPGPLMLPSGLVPDPNRYALGQAAQIFTGDSEHALEKLLELQAAWRGKLEAVLNAA